MVLYHVLRVFSTLDPLIPYQGNRGARAGPGARERGRQERKSGKEKVNPTARAARPFPTIRASTWRAVRALGVVVITGEPIQAMALWVGRIAPLGEGSRKRSCPGDPACGRSGCRAFGPGPASRFRPFGLPSLSQVAGPGLLDPKRRITPWSGKLWRASLASLPPQPISPPGGATAGAGFLVSCDHCIDLARDSPDGRGCEGCCL